MNIKITDVRAHNGENAFLIDDGKTAILYDSGFAFNGFIIADNIKKELGDRKLDYIFLSHSHYDHALASAYVLEYWPEAKVVAGEYAAKIFAKPTARAVMRDLDKKFAAKCGVNEYTDLIDNLRVDITVADGDTIDAGDMHFQALNLPGHTKCSVGFYLTENKLLLGSETLGIYAGDGVFFPSYLVGYKMTMDSIKRVRELDIDSILVPHYGIMTGEEAQNYILSSERVAKETADDLLKFIQEGKSDDELMNYYSSKFFSKNAESFYPKDARELNSSITFKLFRQILAGEKE